MRKYKYLIFYWNTDRSKIFGMGNAQLITDKKIKDIEHIREIEKMLNEGNECKCNIINYKLLGRAKK